MLAEDYLKHLDCEVSTTTRQEDDEEQWVQDRMLGIGGSDVGSILGVNKYSSARLTYLTKTGQYTPEFSDDAIERMAWGHKLEPVVAEEFQLRTGKKVVEAPATLRHKDNKWALANVDRLIIDDEGNPIGILEIKTANWRLNEDWLNGEIPMSYIYQLQWYLYVTGLKYGAFAALVGGNSFHYYEVFYNEELIQNEILPACSTFWNFNMSKGIEPEVTGSDGDTEYVKEQNKEVKKNTEIELTEDELNSSAATIIETKAKIKELNSILKAAENKIKDNMGTHELGYTTDHIIKWSPRKQTRVDTDTLKTNYPDIYDKCKKEIHFRVMTVK